MEVSKSEFFKNRLFLPLKSEAFDWYQLGKSIEIRQQKGRFKNILESNYKYAELRKGYNGESIYCEISHIKEFDSFNDLIDNYDIKSIFPPCNSEKEALEKYTNFYLEEYPLIAISLRFISIV
ncbi:hypothetical protein [Flagellimonas flava]|uniref:hypothetical protein n=1 Tax=Flagellimonas flava TaxID=570519 RepID=UPI003D65E67B